MTQLKVVSDEAGVETIKGRGNYIGTYLRGRFYPFDPRPEEVHIEDIAHALSMIVRFNGHVDRFYSVAEHSVYVSMNVRGINSKRWGLMHDASEAYIGDVVRPIKKAKEFGNKFDEVEAKVHAAIAKRFGLHDRIPDAVHKMDNIICATEKRDLIAGSKPWSSMPDPLQNFEIPAREIGPTEAKTMFLRRFYELFEED